MACSFLTAALFLAFLAGSGIIGLCIRKLKEGEHQIMKHKKLRTVLIAVVVIAALVAAYVIAFMRPQPLLDCLDGTEAPTTGTLTVYDQVHQEGQKWDVIQGAELDEVWQAIQSTQVRFLQGRGVVTLPDGGAYYEVKLANEDGSSSYAFGCNSDGDLIIAGSDYDTVGDSSLPQALADLAKGTTE